MDRLATAPPVGEVDSRHQLEALYHLAVELSGLRDVDQVLDTALGHCLTLTGSQFGFIGLCGADPSRMEIAAINGFHPTQAFYERHRHIPLRPNIFANAVLENRPVRSADARVDPTRVGQPEGHPEVQTFLGVPLRQTGEPIGMIGVANRHAPYEDGHERLLLTYAAQVAIVIRNAQLYTQLARSNEQLERTVTERTAQLREAGRQLADKAAALERVLAETVDAQEQERQRIARDVHDGINQLLVAAMLELTSGQRRLEQGAVEDATEALAACQGILREVETEIRRVVHDLHPPVLEGLGLPAALRRLCTEMADHAGLRVRVVVEGEPIRLDTRAETALYRICQEALGNAAAHADPGQVTVALRFSPELVSLSVADDGVGFDPAAVVSEGHLGLRSMEQRAESLGGELAVRSRPGGGTTVTARVPTP